MNSSISTTPQLVVFDMAGTTVRDEGGAVNHCLRAALLGGGIIVTPEQVNTVMGIAKPLAIEQLLPTPNATQIAAIYTDFVARMQDYYRNDASVGEIDGIRPVFAALRAAGIKVALDTGFAREIVDVLLERLAWHDLVDATICSDEVQNGRPHPDMILALMERLAIASSSSVAKVGDTPSDLAEGASARCQWNIGVTYGSHTEAELTPLPHTHLIHTPREILSILLPSEK
jgi:phosphonatase-like hydrolase